jgi:hypothetical protein
MKNLKFAINDLGEIIPIVIIKVIKNKGWEMLFISD